MSDVEGQQIVIPSEPYQELQFDLEAVTVQEYGNDQLAAPQPKRTRRLLLFDLFKSPLN